MSRPSGAWGPGDVPDQTGRRVVITGGNAGIGFETARMLADAGADVLITSRSTLRGARAREELAALAPAGTVEVARLDLADLSSVHAFAESVRAAGRPVDVLVNNAGIMAVPQGRTADGFELQFGTNHLGHFALTGLLLPSLLAGDRARVVTVSSLAHARGTFDWDDIMGLRSPYRRYGAYARSKLANLLFAFELHRRFRRAGIAGERVSVACHPGLASTGLAAGVAGGTWGKAVSATRALPVSITQSAADGALPSVRAATDPDAGGGDVFGPAGRGQIRGPAVVVKTRPRSREVHDARALWEQSVALTGVDYAALER